MTTDRAEHTEHVSIWVTILLGLYDPPRTPRKREKATNQQDVDSPPFSHSLLRNSGAGALPPNPRSRPARRRRTGVAPVGLFLPEVSGRGPVNPA